MRHLYVICWLAILSAWLLVETDRASADGGIENVKRQAGKWTAVVELKMVGNPMARAWRYRQRVLRQGPDDKEPVLLFEESSTGRVQINLRDDGLLLVQPVRTLPQMYFAGSKDPVTLNLPPPKNWTLRPAPSGKIGTTWFLGDCLFYCRKPRPGYLLIGFVRVDAAKKTTTDSKLGVEVADSNQSEARAAEVLPIVFRVGDYVLWVNRGHHTEYHPEAVQGEWKQRKVRCLSLAKGELVDAARIPEAVLRQNKDRLLEFVEKQAHNRSPELEIWAVGAIARIGDAKDAERLKALSRTVVVTMNAVSPTTLESTDKPVKAAYAVALEQLKKTSR
jgi:hypothetical protein